MRLGYTRLHRHIQRIGMARCERVSAGPSTPRPAVWPSAHEHEEAFMYTRLVVPLETALCCNAGTVRPVNKAVSQ